MRVTRRIRLQLTILTLVTLASATTMALGYLNLPAMLFGVGRYTVILQLPEAGGLYPTGNVTYRGTTVGRIASVDLSTTGVNAVLSLKSDIAIPSDLDAEVHSQSAVGEQYVALLPRNSEAAPLRDGDIIPRDRTTVPPDINNLLDTTNRGLQAIPHDNLKTAIDEAAAAVGGLGSELSQLVDASTTLAIDARNNLDPLTTLIDKAPTLLNAQTASADSVGAWAANLASITDQLRTNDDSLGLLLQDGSEAADQTRRLIERLQPTIPVLLANLVSIGQVALTYQPAVEQLLVLLPQGIAQLQGARVANKNTKSDYDGGYLDFKLSFNMAHPCTTGFLPAQQIRSPALQDNPERPGGLYCRIPQDSPNAVRGARNLPCLTVPGKRAPTVKMCESNEQYVPLNDGDNWKGDPNATLSGQDIPQLDPPSTTPPEGSAAADSPQITIPTAPYDPATGAYLAPDGRVHTRADLVQPATERTWQQLLIPPSAGN